MGRGDRDDGIVGADDAARWVGSGTATAILVIALLSARDVFGWSSWVLLLVSVAVGAAGAILLPLASRTVRWHRSRRRGS